jgi:hypothetical protein
MTRNQVQPQLYCYACSKRMGSTVLVNGHYDASSNSLRKNDSSGGWIVQVSVHPYAFSALGVGVADFPREIWWNVRGQIRS